MEWQDFRKLSTNEKRYKAEQMTDLSLNCDFWERNAILSDIVNAKNEDEYLTAIEMLEKFEESYK